MASVYENILMACLGNKSSSRLTESVGMGLLEGESDISDKTKELAEADETVLFDDEDTVTDDVDELADTFEDEIANLDKESTDTEEIVDADVDVDADTKDEEAEDDGEALLVTAVTTDDLTDEEALNADVDDFIDNFVYHCKCCGKVILSVDAMDEGEACPECGKVNVDEDNNEGCLDLIGKIAPIEDGNTDEETADDLELADTEDADADVANGEDTEEETADADNADADFDVVEEESDEELAAKESYRHRAYDRKNVKERKTTMNNENRNRSLMLDESTFNPFLKKFVTENYENASSFRVVGAKKAGRRLTLECRLTFKSGRSKKVNLVSENFKPVNGGFTFTATENGTFKIENNTRKSPFIFKATMRNGVVRCEGLKYDYNTVIGEKKYKVYGSLIKESRSR